MAHPRAHPALGVRDACRFGSRPRVPARDAGRDQRLSRPAARHRLLQRLCRRHPCAGRQARGGVRLAGAARARTADLRRQDSVFRLALSTLFPVHRRAAGADALRSGVGGVAGGDACALSRRGVADPALLRSEAMRTETTRAGEPAVAAHRPRLPGGVHQHRPRAQRLSHRGADRHGAGGARPPAAGRRSPVRPDGLQAAIRRADPAGAGRDRPLARVHRRSGDSRGPHACNICRVRPRRLARSSARRISRASRCWSRAAPAGTRSRACSRWCGCGAAASPSPTRRKAH